MSGSGPKTKGTDQIKFFKIDREGEIAEAFPADSDKLNAGGQDGEKPGAAPGENNAEGPVNDGNAEGPAPGVTGTFSRIEPVFSNEPAQDEMAPSEPLAPIETEIPPLGLEDPFSEPLALEPLPGSGEAVGSPIEAPSPVTSDDPEREVQIDLLKPQIDDISRQKGAFSNDQVGILRRYISLKEAEVRDLRDQQQQYQAFLKKVSSQVDQLTRRNRDLLESNETLKGDTEALRKELAEIKDRHRGELAMVKNEYEDRVRRSGKYDAQAEEFYKKREEWKEKVREELKRIKLKERELENKHELLKRDMQALLDSKDKHMLEIKKKHDAIELELETLEDRLRRANVVLASIDSKKKRLIETMKLAIALLEEIDRLDDLAGTADDNERKAG